MSEITFYAASFNQRYDEPSTVYISTTQGKAEDAAEKAMQFERRDLPGYCDNSRHNDCDCQLCYPDLVLNEEYTYSARDLFTAKELRENRHELRAGEVICLGK